MPTNKLTLDSIAQYILHQYKDDVLEMTAPPKEEVVLTHPRVGLRNRTYFDNAKLKVVSTGEGARLEYKNPITRLLASIL